MAQPWLVMKFGGTSVSTADRWANVAALVKARQGEGYRVVLVHSALAGISNLLLSLLEAARNGQQKPVLDELQKRHVELAVELNVDGDRAFGELFEELVEIADGIERSNECLPQTHARVLSVGELASTRIGAAYLKSCELPVRWRDARKLLVARPDTERHRHAHYLSARCDVEFDPELVAELDSDLPVIVTQGFIASDADGETVLLGRGGSDTSASCLAAKIAAERLEIWTDVHGMFSADPRVAGSARLIRTLRYDEAQEIASAGGSILHPRCVTPVRKASIPMLVGNTAHPESMGTLISDSPDNDTAQLKAICCRSGLTLISMQSMDMWQQVGFLAEVFDAFRRHGVCIDLVATSESNVTVSIDTDSDAVEASTVRALVAELNVLCSVTVIPDCTAVSLVGRNISGVLHKIGPALRAFEGEKMHLVSQAANGLNLTFVVDTDEANPLVAELHSLLIDQFADDRIFGATWTELTPGAGA